MIKTRFNNKRLYQNNNPVLQLICRIGNNIQRKLNNNTIYRFKKNNIFYKNNNFYKIMIICINLKNKMRNKQKIKKIYQNKRKMSLL